MWTIFKVLIKFVRVLLLFYVLVLWPQGTQDVRAPRTKPIPPALEVGVLLNTEHQGSPAFCFKKIDWMIYFRVI